MIRYSIYKSTKEFPNSWDTLAEHDIFLKSRYLKALENSTPNNMQLLYIGVFKNNKLVGITLVQHLQLYFEDMLKKTDVSGLKSFFKNTIAKLLKGDILVVGNLTHTGQHGFSFNEKSISQLQFVKTIFSALSVIKQQIKIYQKKEIRLIMLKDYFVNSGRAYGISSFKTLKLHQVSVQPNMLLPLKENWETIEHYKANLSKKYRDRYKSARKKCKDIQIEEMDLVTIKNKSKILHTLYKNVSSKAKFNTFVLTENHFYSLKLELKDDFKIFGYYRNNELIGFYTLLLNNKKLETYFLGYNPAYQKQNQLYLNMLYDMLNFAICNKFSVVVYARTALEIKSSVGAKPFDMVMYLKHTNRLFNTLLNPVFKFMNPTIVWKQRHPFKD